jgi:Caspase domain/N-acetylmuramoyl-L-alanine amidase
MARRPAKLTIATPADAAPKKTGVAMPAPFQRLRIDQFAAVLEAFEFRRRITAVHMHHTWRPNHAQWKGHDSMVGMWRFHTQTRKFSDIAQHLTIDPEGQVWTGRNWNAAPASAIGHNGTAVAGPFMFEIVGDFDVGRDLLQGAQRQAVLDVIALVQAHFGLAPETLMFHNQAADKTCPGSATDYTQFVAELRAHVPTLAPPMAEAAVAAAGGKRSRRGAAADGAAAAARAAEDEALLVQRTVRLIDPDSGASRAAAGAPPSSPMEELDYDTASEAARLAANTLPAMSRDGGEADGSGRATITPEEIDALRPYVLNLSMGGFSSDGLMTSSPADIDRIVNEHLAAAAKAAAARGETLRVVLYAHGGLVRESKGLALAARHVGWWRDNGVYPIHFVWETGLFETIRGLLERARSPLRERGLGEVITDRLTDPLIEAAVRALQAGRIWGGMKASAQAASAPGGAARALLEALATLVKSSAAAIELHAVGHSAGSIFHAHLLPAARAVGLPPMRSLQFMAPALRVDAFGQLVQPLLGAHAGPLTVYTMRRDFERDDDCAKLYRKSLLYLVSNACENGDAVPLLGLEDSLRADAGLRALFGLGQAGSGLAEVVWSKSLLAEGRSATRAVHHGDFDDDAPTVNSVARRVLGLADAAPLPRPFAASRAIGDAWRDGPDWPEELLPSTPPSTPPPGPIAPAAAPTGSPPPSSAPAVTPAARPPQPASGSGRRLALCVGIDNYPSAPLAGCHQDARLWQQTLQALGFDAAILLDPDRRGLVSAIGTFFAGARSGDELVLQYAGHGTHVDDLDGDESDGQDEALCPLDFDSGALLIDDDLGALIDRIAPGARLTMFMDCCHSGTNTRMAGPRAAAPPPGARPRFVKPTPALQQAHRLWREVNGSSAALRRGGAPELAFAACQDHEVAWESGGHGEFTLRATRVLAAANGRLSARQLQQQVLAAFGPAPRQQPRLNGPEARLDAWLFSAP